MSIQFPPECAWLFAILTGEVPPDGDEDKMFALAEVHKDLHGKLNKDFQAMVADVLGYTKQNFDGDAAKMYQEAMKSFLGGQEGLDYFNAVGDQAQLVADFTRKSATQLQYTKYMIIAQLVALLIEAAFAAATAFFFGASIAVYLKKQAIVRVILKTKLGRLVVTLLTHQIINVGMGVTMDAMIQWIQLNQGTRDEWDTELTKNAALSGMVQGLLAGPFNALGDRFGKLLAKMFGLDAGRNLGNKIDGVLPPPKPKDLDVKPLPKKPDAKTEAPVPPPKDAPVPPPKDAPAPKPKTESGTPEPAPKPKPETGEPAPKPGSNKPDTDKPGPQPPVSFGRDMSEAFRKNLPNTYGPGSAKAGRQFVDDVGEAFRRRFGDGAVDAGRDWARTLLEKTGTRELPDALEKSLGPIAKDLGPDLTKVLSQGAADSLGRSILREIVEGTGRGVFEGAHAAVSEGMYNLIFSDEHTFKTSGLTFGSGMVEGRLGAMMEAGGENLAMGLRGNLGMAPPSWLTDGNVAGAGSGGTASPAASGGTEGKTGGLTGDMPDLQLDEFYDEAGSLTADMRNFGIDDLFDDASSLTSDMRNLGLDDLFDGGNEDGPVMAPPVTAPVPTATGGGAGAGGSASTAAPQSPAAQPTNQSNQSNQGNQPNQTSPRNGANDNGGSGAEKPAMVPMESNAPTPDQGQDTDQATLVGSIDQQPGEQAKEPDRLVAESTMPTPDSTDERGGNKDEPAPAPSSVTAPATMSGETLLGDDMLSDDDDGELDHLDVSSAPPLLDDTPQNVPESSENNTAPITPPFAMTTDIDSDDGDSFYTASEFSVYTDPASEPEQLGSDGEETADTPAQQGDDESVFGNGDLGLGRLFREEHDGAAAFGRGDFGLGRLFREDDDGPPPFERGDLGLRGLFREENDGTAAFDGGGYAFGRLFREDARAEGLAPAVRDLGTNNRGVPGGVQLSTVGPGVVNALRRDLLTTLGIRPDDPHRADVERQLDTLISPQALHDNRVMLLSPDGHRITVFHNGTGHPLDVRLNLSEPKASEMYGSSGRFPPRNNEDRLSSGYDRTSQGGTSAVRTVSLPGWAGSLVNKLNTLAVPVLGDVWNRITAFSLSVTPTIGLGRHTLSTTVAQAVVATTMMRSGERAIPFDYRAAWSIRTPNDGTPAPADTTGDGTGGIPLQPRHVNLWSDSDGSGIVTAWFPKHLTVSGDPSGQTQFVSRDEREFRAHLEKLPLWTMDSMTDPGSLLRHAETQFGREFDQLSPGSRDAFRRFFGGPQQLGALPLQYTGSDGDRSSQGTVSPLLVDRDGNAVGMFKVTASITPTGDPALRDIHVTDTYNFERALDRQTKVDAQAKVSRTLGADGAFGATLNTQQPGEPSALRDFNLGITSAVKGSGSLQKDQSFGAGSTHNMLRNLRANGGHVLTPARVTYQVTFVGADGTPRRAADEMTATNVWIRTLHPDTVTETAPTAEQTVAPPTEVADLQSLGVSATPIAVDGAGARAVLAETRRWLTENGYLPRTETVTWPGGEALVKARLENLRDLDLFTSSHGLQAGADELVDGGYTLHFNKPGFGGTNERIAVTLDLRRPAPPADGTDAPPIRHLKRASGVVIPNISGITIPGNSSRTRTTSWSLGGSVDAGRAVGDSAVRLSGNAEIKKTWQNAHTLTTGSGLAYSQLLGTSKQSTEVFRVPAELHLTISAGRETLHDYHSGMFTPADRDGSGTPNDPGAYLDVALPEKRVVSATTPTPTTGDVTVTDQGGLLPDNAMVDIMRGSSVLNDLVNSLIRQSAPEDGPGDRDTEPGDLAEGAVLPTHTRPAAADGSGSLVSSLVDAATTVRRVVTGDDRAAQEILLSEALHAQLTPGALTARAHQMVKGVYVIDDLFVPGATVGTDLVVEIRARMTNVRHLDTVSQYGEVDLGFIDSASHQTSTTTSLEGGGGLGLKSGPDRRAAEAAAAGTPAADRPVTGGGGAKAIHGRGTTHAVTAAVSTSNTHVPSESGTYHRMAADIEYEVTVVRGHRGGPVHAAPVTLRGSDTVRGGMQFLATPEQLRHSGQLTGLAGIDRQDDRPQDIPLPDRFRTHGIAGLATVLEVTPLTAPLPAPQPPGTEAPATQPATAPANEPAQQQPGPDPRDFLRTRLTELISTETPGALTPGSSHYVPGLRQRIADFTSPAAMAALVGRGGDQPLAFTFPYPDGLTTKNVTVRLSGRTGWDATALENARGRAAAAGAGLETFSQHAPNNITDARSTTTKWGASGSGSASVPTAATGSRKLGVSPGAAHSTTRTDTVTTTTTAEDRIWQRTDGGAEFKLAWTFNAEISVDGVNRGAIPEVNASVTLRFAHDNAPAAAGPVIERLPAGVQEQDPRTGLTRAEATPVRPSGTEVVYGAPQSLPLLNAIHAVAPSLVDAEGLISGTSQEAAAVRITELLHGGEITVDPLRQASGLGGPPVHTADGNPRTTLSTEILRPKLLGDSHGVTIDRVRQTGFGITAGSSTSRTTNATLGVNHTVDTEGNHTLGASTSPFHYQSVPQGQGGGDSAAGRRWTKVGSAGQRTATSGLHTHEIEADSVTTVTGPDGTRHVTGTVVLRVSELDLLGLGVLPDADRGDGVWDLSAPPRRPDNVSDPGPGNPGTRPDAVIVEHLVRAREEQENVLDTDRRMPQLWTTLPHGDRNDPEWRAAEQQAMDRAARIARESQLTVELAVRDDDGIRYRVFDPETADAEGSRGTEIDGPGGPRSDSLAAQPLDRPTPSVATVSSSSAPPPPPPPPVRNRPEGNTETAAASPPPRDPDASRPVKPPRAEGDFVQHRVGRQELPVRGRDDTVAVSTERFDPKLRQDDRPAGRLSGSETRIRYRVSREQLPDGRTARHFFVTLPFKRGQDVSTTDLTDLQKRVQSLLDTHINRGYRLPGSGDQLMVTTGFLDKPDRSDAITLTRTPVPGRADQLHWDVNDHDAVLTHELLHYLGLPDEYLDTPGRQEGDPHIFRARQDRTGVHDDGLMAVADTASLSRVLADHLAVIERVSDTANIPLHTTSAAQPTAPSRMLAPDSTPEYPASQSNRGRGGRGGGNANRGGPPDSRGGGNANRGGPPQSRGGGNANRGGPPQSRGGGNANRGGPPDSRGGGNANRGGPPQSRGGGNANRGGPPQGRGGGNANRGGHTAHGPAAANSTAAPTTTVPYVNNHFQSRFGSATADTLNPNQYRTAVRDSVRQMRPISFVVNAMVDWNTLTREPETIDRFVQAVLQGRRSENPPEVAIVIGVNGRVNSANPGVEQNILNAIRNATTDRNWSVPVALVAVPMRLRQSDDFPYGTARNHVLTSDATSRALNGMRTTTHPYMSFMDLDPYPHLTPSGRHVFEHFENRLSFDDMTDLGYAPLRPLLISGGYTIPAATDTQGRDRLVRETLARWNTRFGDRPSDVENTIPMFDDLIRHDMRVRSRMAETAPLVPYSPEPNLFADGLAILLDIPADHQALGPVRFSRGAGEYHGLADSLMRLAAWEIANDAADGIREVGDRNRTGRTDRSELTAQVHVAADHLRPAARGTAFLVDFENGATQTDLSRLFVGMLESRRKTAEATEGGQHPDPGALHVPQSHTNPPPFGRLFTLDRTDREALKNAPPFNNAALRSSDLMNGRPLAPDPAADPLNLFADKPLKQAASVPVPGHPGLFAGLGPDQQRLHALNLLNVTDEAVLQRGFHTFATMYLSDGGEGLNTRPRSFFDALGQALSPGTSPLRTHGDGSPVTPSVAPWSAAHDGVATMLQSVITTHTDEVPQPLAVAPERTPAEQERDRAAWIRSGAQEARTLVARAQEAGMTVEDLLVRLFTGRIHPMSHNFDEYTVPVPPQQESSAAAAARRTTPLEGPFTLDGSALLLLGLYADGLGRTLVVTGPDGTTETVRPQGPSAGELRVVWTAHGWSVPEPVATSSGSTAPAPRPGAGGGGRGLDQQAFDILTGSKGSGSGKGGKR